MFEKIRKMKNKKGFTLVELIVVLVILAILAALLIPALTGYIDRANNQKVIATTHQVVMAAQTVTSEDYAKAATGKLTAGNLTSGGTPDLDEVLKLAEITLNQNGVTAVTVHVTMLILSLLPRAVRPAPITRMLRRMPTTRTTTLANF